MVFSEQAVDAVLHLLQFLVLNDKTVILSIPSRRSDCYSGADIANSRALGKSQVNGDGPVFVRLVSATNDVNTDSHGFTLFAACTTICRLPMKFG